jgi:hypothetical protein
MLEKNQENIIFILTKDDILACARELKIPEEQVADETIELVKDKINREFGRWPEIVKEVLTQVSRCPLGLTCFPSCCWWKEGRCIFPR